MNLTIGSGDVTKLLSGTNTKGFAELIQKFVATDKPYYNAFASPIDALRTGAILELRYIHTLTTDYYSQYKARNKDFDCMVSSIDFAKIEKGKVVDFDELKTMFLPDYIEYISPIKDLGHREQLYYLKKNFKSNYNQVQFQLMCTGLEEANLVFLTVETYEDEKNIIRDIKENDYHKFRIKRDLEVIEKITERIKFFQQIKDYTK